MKKLVLMPVMLSVIILAAACGKKDEATSSTGGVVVPPVGPGPTEPVQPPPEDHSAFVQWCANQLGYYYSSLNLCKVTDTYNLGYLTFMGGPVALNFPVAQNQTFRVNMGSDRHASVLLNGQNLGSTGVKLTANSSGNLALYRNDLKVYKPLSVTVSTCSSPSQKYVPCP